jgi:hypothetical protein
VRLSSREDPFSGSGELLSPENTYQKQHYALKPQRSNNFMVKPILSALCATTLSLSLLSSVSAQQDNTKKTTAPAPPADPNVVATVNDTKFTWDQVIARMEQDNKDGLQASIAAITGQEAAKAFFGNPPKAEVTISKALAIKALREQPTQQVMLIVRMMQDEEMMRQELSKQSLKVEKSEVEAYLKKVLANLRAQKQIPEGTTDDQFLSQQGLNREQALRSLYMRVAAGALWLKDFEKSTLGHALSPNDFLRARHILVAFKRPMPGEPGVDPKKQEEAALAKIKKIQEEIKSGKKQFELAAAEYGEDSTNKSGGDLGAFTRGAMVKDFENAAYALKPGVVSEPVRTQFGYHLIRVDKLGKDLSEMERDNALEQMKGRGVSELLLKMRQRNKLTTTLKAPEQPQGLPGGE